MCILLSVSLKRDSDSKLSLFLFTVRFFRNFEMCFTIEKQCFSPSTKFIQLGSIQNIRKETKITERKKNIRNIISIYHRIFIIFGILFPDTITQWLIRVKTKISERISFFRCEEGSILELLLFLFTVRFFWNLELCFMISLQGDSIGLKLRYQSESYFLVCNKIIFIYCTIFLKFVTHGFLL